MSSDPSKLTEKELEILNHLAEAWNGYVNLQGTPFQDKSEFCHHIHVLQRAVAYRAAQRANPEELNL